MSCDRRCYKPENLWYDFEICNECEGADDGHRPGSRPLPGDWKPTAPEAPSGKESSHD
jgi:hypothetical protein